MIILIDLTSLADNFSGIERFALSITKELVSDREIKNKYILVFKNNVHPEFNDISEHVETLVINGRNKLIFNQFLLPLKLFGIRADYYFFPSFPAPFFFFRKNAITTIHDMGMWDSPSNNKAYMIWYFKIMYWKAALGNKRIITVSEFSKSRIKTILKKKFEQINVIYNGLSDCFTKFEYDDGENNRVIKSLKLPKTYILCLSTIEPRKNMRLLLEAYDELLREKRIDIDLVLAGRKGWAVDNLLNGISNYTLKRVVFTGFIDDDQLPYVYRNAKLFVFPSVYEGFGIPPLEAMSMGVPVISSNTSSLPEILGDAAIYFKSRDKEDLKQKILQVLAMSDIDLREIKDRGRFQSQQFKWNKEALKLRTSVFI